MDRTARAALGGLLGSVAATAMLAVPAAAGGIERANQSIGIIFEPGRVVELGFSTVSPTIDGTYAVTGARTGDVAKSYSAFSLAYKQDLSDSLSAAVIIDQPLGADITYPLVAGGLLSGTEAIVDSTHITGILRWKSPNGFGVHGGVRAATASGEVTLSGPAYGPLTANGAAPYHVELDRTTNWGWLAGVSWERPDIAARVSLTYNSPITHKFDTTETSLVPPLNGNSETEVVSPRAWNLEFQTGVAQDTLVFGSVRWVKWSEFRVDPARFTAVAGQGLVDLEDTTTWTLGVGRKFTDHWSGSASVFYEKPGDGLVSPLAPYSGRTGLTLAAIYTQDNMKITAGINYTKLGDSDTRPDLSGAAGLGLGASSMEDNSAVGFGIKTSFTF